MHDIPCMCLYKLTTQLRDLLEKSGCPSAESNNMVFKNMEPISTHFYVQMSKYSNNTFVYLVKPSSQANSNWQHLWWLYSK